MNSNKTDLSNEKSKLMQDLFNDAQDLECLSESLHHLHSKIDDPMPIKFELRSLFHTVQLLHLIHLRLAEALDAIYSPDESNYS